MFRISFSGELAFELNVPSWQGQSLWEAVMAAGAPLGITPYGTETLHILRAEKGYPIIGQETDGTVTPDDLGMGALASTKKDWIGRRSQHRPDTLRPDRKQLVGVLPVDPDMLLPEGAQLVDMDADLSARPVPMLGHVTSSYRSAALGRTFALALVKGGRTRIGERVRAPLLDGSVVEADDHRAPCSSIRRTGDATGSPSHDDRRRRLARPFAARGRGPARHACASCRSWPRSTSAPTLRTPRCVGRLASVLGTRSRSNRTRPRPPPTARASSCGWAPTSGSSSVSPERPPRSSPPPRRLRRAGAGAAAVVDVSANRTTISIAGPRARDLLAFGCSIDLDPRAFGPGRCAQTMLARAQVIIVPVGPEAEPAFRVLVRPSFAAYLAAWLADAAVGLD